MARVRWLLVALVGVFVALAAPACGAGGDDEPPADALHPRAPGAGADAAPGAGDASSDAASSSTDDEPAGAALPRVPLSVEGRFIVDRDHKRFRMHGTNWEGFGENQYVVEGLEHHPLRDVVALFRRAGINVVRIPFSVEVVIRDPMVPAEYVAGDPSLQNLHALEVLDKVIAELGRQGILVILDNHTSDAGWCCSTTDENGLWYNQRWTGLDWRTAWQTMVTRYGDAHAWPNVVAAELRNEPRSAVYAGTTITPSWGDDDHASDFKYAYEWLYGQALTGTDWLVIADGLAYATDLRAVAAHPITAIPANRLAYAAHSYEFDVPSGASCDAMRTAWGNAWGYVLGSAPVVVTEFGTDSTSYAHLTSTWARCFLQYLDDGDFDWTTWTGNGSYGSCTNALSTTHAEGEFQWGLLDWDGPQAATNNTGYMLETTNHTPLWRDLLARRSDSTQGPDALHAVSVAVDAAGKAHVAATLSSGRVALAVESAPGGAFGAPIDLGGDASSAPVTLANAHAGFVEVFVRGADGAVWESNDAAGSWSAFAATAGPLGGGGGAAVAGTPAVLAGPGGHDVMLATGTDNHLYYVEESGDAPGAPWGAWKDLGGSADSDPVAVLDGQDVRAFVRRRDGAVDAICASCANASFTHLGGAGGGYDLAVAQDPKSSGAPVLFAVAADRSVAMTEVANGAPSPWQTLAFHADTDPAAAVVGGRVTAVFGASAGGGVTTITPATTARDGGWTSASAAAPRGSTPAIAVLPDGSPLVVVASGGALSYRAGAATSWTALPMGGPVRSFH